MRKLREAREEKGWTQQELADQSGVNQSTIAGLELGKHRPQIGTLKKLADALDVRISDLREQRQPPRSDEDLRKLRDELESRIESDIWETALKSQTDRVLRNLMLRIRDELEYRNGERTNGKEQWTVSQK